MKNRINRLMGFVVQYTIPLMLVGVSLLLLASPYPYLAPLPAISLLALLWFGKRSLFPYLFYGIVMLIPFGAYRGLGGQFGFVRFHWVFAIALAAFVVIGTLLRKKIPDQIRHGKFWAGVFLFYLLNFFSALGARYPEVSTRFMVLLAAGYMLVALGMIVVDQKGFAVLLPRVIVGSVFLSSLMAVLGSVFHLSWFVSQSSGRVLGGAPDPNNMALMIIFSLPVAVYFLLTARSALARIGIMAMIGIDVAAVVATYSRGGAVILCISFLLMLWEYRRLVSPRNLGLLFGLGGFACAILLMLTPDSYIQRIQSIRGADDFSMRRRASYILVARDLVAQRPLLGMGPDAFATSYASTEIGRSFKRKNQTAERAAHNTYLEVLVGSGILGLIAFLSVLICAFRSFCQAQKGFMIRGRVQMALLAVAYRTSFLTLLLYLLFYSDVTHKYLLLSLAISQIALRLSKNAIEPEDDYGVV